MKLFQSVQSIRWTMLAILLAPGSSLAAQRLTLLPQSALYLSGDSTLHPFTSTATVIQLTSEVEMPAGGGGLQAVLQPGALKTLELKIPVQGLKSKESSLDKNMYKALKAKEHPEILFTLSRYEVTPSSLTTAGSHVKAIGTLSVAGSGQTIQLDLEAVPEADTLRARGAYTLVMTDYGIKPPTMMMGTIKVRNPITIYFDLYLR